MSEHSRLEARAQAYRRAEAIAVGLVIWCEQHGVRPDSFHHRADEARRQAIRAERQLARIRPHPGSTVSNPA